MPRLIDAEHLKKRATDTTGDCWDNYGQGTADFLEYIDKEPTVDAEPVVRCKDCKKYIPCQKLPIGTSKWCDLFDRATCEMNYCGWGERREDE